MIEPKFIKKDTPKQVSLNYDELLSIGIQYIQKFSGKQWTDYNYHDPGITFLEQLCFALTDLGYKSNFPIEDILLAFTDDFDLEYNNLLIPPEKVFPSSPLTTLDFRKIIINQEVNVMNAWVNPIQNNFAGIHGIYDVLIQFRDELNDSQISKSITNIEDILMENRSLGTDFNSIIVLKKDIITLSGEITINSFVLGESILAEIYHKIDLKLNKDLKHYDYEDILLEDKLENIFSGPVQKNRFIKENDLKDKTNQIYQYEIKEIIQSIDGVLMVDNLILFKNGIRMYDDIISFAYDSYPSLDKEYSDANTSRLKFVRNEINYKIDTKILSQLFDSISLNNKRAYVKNFKSKKIIKPGRFNKKEIEHYFSIQNELPSIYGLKKDELTSKSSPKRKSQVNQLKGYLLLFEQIMASYLSQLVNIRNLFSINIDESTLRTYFNQIPRDISGLNKIIKNNEKTFLDFVNNISESNVKLLNRKNEIVNHILARFGETYNQTLLSKFDTNMLDFLSDDEIQLRLLNSKLNYAKEIINLGGNRVKGFNYKKSNNLENNISGLKKRLNLILNIQINGNSSCLDYLLKRSELSKENTEWTIESVRIEGDEEINIYSSNLEKDIQDSANFYCEDYDCFKALFLYAFKKKNYEILKSNSSFYLLFNNPKLKFPVNIFQSKSKKKCFEILNKSIKQFKNLNIECESFFIVENILLRPKIETNFVLQILDDNKDILLKSYYNSEKNFLRDLKDDLFILIKNRNISIEKESKTNEFILVVYDSVNKPILKSNISFVSKEKAKKEKLKILRYLLKQKELNVSADSFTKINKIKNALNTFPNFKYSNHINFIFPDWPFRFQSREFKNLIYQNIYDFIPAHLSYNVFYLNFNEMLGFESTYFNWLKYKAIGDLENTELNSLQLIQLISSYKNYASS